MLDLAGLWTLVDDTGEWRCDMSLPGDTISALHDARLIPDPYFGRNEYDLRWICQRDWIVSRSFMVEDQPGVMQRRNGIARQGHVTAPLTRVIDKGPEAGQIQHPTVSFRSACQTSRPWPG